MLELFSQTRVAGTGGVDAGGGHRDQLAIGRQFQHRLGIGLAHQGELLGAKGIHRNGRRLGRSPQTGIANGERSSTWR